MNALQITNFDQIKHVSIWDNNGMSLTGIEITTAMVGCEVTVRFHQGDLVPSIQGTVRRDTVFNDGTRQLTLHLRVAGSRHDLITMVNGIMLIPGEAVEIILTSRRMTSKVNQAREFQYNLNSVRIVD